MKPLKTIPATIAASLLASTVILPLAAYGQDDPAKDAPAPAAQNAAAPAEAAKPGDAPGAPAEAAKAEGEAKEEVKFSETQNLLFDTPHLQNITTPSVITYKFERKSRFNDGFKDTVKLKIDRVLPDGAKDVSFEFFTGPRNRPYPAQEHFNGNPLLMLYLSRDVHEMSRMLGGSANFFRTKVRYGFIDKGNVSEVEVPGPNGPVKAKKIEMKPFIGEMDRSYEMGPNLQKSYEFIVSEDIPGGLYSIRTVVPPEPGKEDLGNVIEESLVYDSVAASPVADAKKE